MSRKHTIALGVALAVFVVGIFLSMIRSKSVQNPVGEIKHFTPKPAKKSPKKPAHISKSAVTPHKQEPTKSVSVSESTKTNVSAKASSDTSSSDNQPIEEPLLEEGILITHRVATGESLLGLAKKYRTTGYQIAKRNMISEDARLFVGQELEIIPGEEATYRVQKRESLSEITQRFGADRQDIAALNDLEANAMLHPNQKLIMPVSQKQIDTVLEAIAEKKRQEELERKSQYQQKFLTRLKLQQNARARLAKLRAEKAAKARKLAQAKREKDRRLRKAKQKFKYTSSTKYQHKMRVVATAYTSHRSQTDRTPFLAAWNNRIRPGMKIIAVSPDLIRRYGLTNGVRVKIGGLPGTYVVRDKMNKRLHNHIDIYMGVNRRRALRWGRRRVVMYW